MTKTKLTCSYVRAWNCKRRAIGYFNGNLICKGCLDIQYYYLENYPNGSYGGTFTPIEELEN